MIGAVEGALFGRRVRFRHPALAGRNLRQHIVEGGVAVADDDHILGGAKPVEHVHVDVSQGFLERVERVSGVVLRP